jgi:hypothetical protein
MDNDGSWNSVVARLRGTGTLAVAQFEVGEPVTNDDIEVIKLMDKTLPPAAIMQFFTSCNGVKLLWSGTLGENAVQGSINIVSLLESTLRAPAQEEGAPLEGVLWDEEFAPRVLRRLKRMAVFEAIAGRSAYLTYFVDAADARLFLVENDRIKPIAPDFDTTVALLKRYAGADNLREHLTHRNWRGRIESDEVLQRIAAL